METLEHPDRTDGFTVRMQGKEVAEMEFYGVIEDGSFFSEDDYVAPRKVLGALNKMGDVETLRIFMNSPGGDVYGGFQIANRLDFMRENGKIKNIETHAEGMVASAATLVFLKGDDRVMRNGARLMIHKPHAIALGNADEMRQMAQRLDQTEEEALDLYEAMSNMPRQELRAAMEAETYYNGTEAVNNGMATASVELAAVAACMSVKLRETFKQLPDDLEIKDPACIKEQVLDELNALHPDHW